MKMKDIFIKCFFNVLITLPFLYNSCSIKGAALEKNDAPQSAVLKAVETEKLDDRAPIKGSLVDLQVCNSETKNCKDLELFSEIKCDEFCKEIFYVTETGKCFHREGCQYLKRFKSCLDIEDLQKKYRPCKRCG